jgi:hypothetical protein
MDIKIGRLFFRTYRCRGPGLRIRLLARQRYLEVWVGRRIAYLAVLHRKDCDCDPCVFDREVTGYDIEGGLAGWAEKNPPPQEWFDENLGDLPPHEGKEFEDEFGDR